MKSRTDFVSIGWMDQLRQAMYNQIKAMGVLLWVLLGFTVGLGNMMMEISPFGAALCAAAPFRYLPAAALGSAAGSLLLSNLAELGGAHTLTIKYTAAILLITLARRTAAHSESTMQRTTAAPLLAFFGLLLPSVASLLAQSFSGYKLVMALAEATMAAACAYFLARGLKAFSLGQGLFTLTRADFISVVLTASMLIVSLSNVTFGGISLGRLLAALAVLLCALAGGERWGAISGIVCGTAVGVALFPKMQLIGIYALAGLAAGVFSNLGRFGCAGAFVLTFGGMSLLSGPPPVMPLVYEGCISAVTLLLLPQSVLCALRAKLFRQPMDSAGKSVRQLMLERLGEASGALREIARTTQAVSHQLDKVKAGSLEQVYDEAVDNICLHCGLKTRCWQQEYTDTLDVFHHLTPLLRQNGSICEEDFGYPLSARCGKRAQLAQQINLGYQEFTAKEGMSRKVARVRSVVTDQFEGLGELLEGLSQELCGISGYEERMMAQVREYLEHERCQLRRVDCYRDRQGRVFLQIDLEPYRVARLELERMSMDLSSVCDCAFALPQKLEITETDPSGRQQRAVRLRFCERAEFTAEFAASQHTCQGCRLCGDACQSFTDRRSVAHIVLSDGMGSGTAAAVDANMTVSLITKLIDAEVSYTAALKIVNSALLVKSGEESLSTIDITAIDLYTGQAHFYKAGAAPTFVRRGNRAGMVESTSLPVGILTAVEFEKSSIKLSDGDLVVMVSDGATACGSDWILSVLDHFAADGNLQALCDDIASTARLRRNDNHDDDITVCACRITKGI